MWNILLEAEAALRCTVFINESVAINDNKIINNDVNDKKRCKLQETLAMKENLSGRKIVLRLRSDRFFCFTFSTIFSSLSSHHHLDLIRFSVFHKETSWLTCFNIFVTFSTNFLLQTSRNCSHRWQNAWEIFSQCVLSNRLR